MAEKVAAQHCLENPILLRALPHFLDWLNWQIPKHRRYIVQFKKPWDLHILTAIVITYFKIPLLSTNWFPSKIQVEWDHQRITADFDMFVITFQDNYLCVLNPSRLHRMSCDALSGLCQWFRIVTGFVGSIWTVSVTLAPPSPGFSQDLTLDSSFFADSEYATCKVTVGLSGKPVGGWYRAHPWSATFPQLYCMNMCIEYNHRRESIGCI